MSSVPQSIAASVTHAASAAARRLAHVSIPAPAREPLFRMIAGRLGADLSQAADTPEAFGSWQDFFTRPLRHGTRPVDMSADTVVSPVDGVVHSAVKIESGQLFQIKGRQYALSSFTGDPSLAERFDGGTAITLYLRPKDYHRIHAPLAMNVTASVYFDGTLWPVNPWANRNVPSLYCRNERLGMLCEADPAPFMLWMVGALFVGGIRTVYARGDDRNHLTALPSPAKFVRGAEIGRFEFGSTVILLFPPSFPLTPRVREGEEIRYGQPLARIV